MITTATSALDRQPEGIAFDITTKKEEDQLKVQVEDGRAILSISSPSGIGGATIKPKTGKWPAGMVLRLHLRGLESLRISNGTETIAAFVTSVGEPTVHCQQIEDGKEKPLGKDSPYWLDIRMLDDKGVSKNKIPLEGGYFEVTVPKALLQGQPESLKVDWIDFYRG